MVVCRKTTYQAYYNILFTMWKFYYHIGGLEQFKKSGKKYRTITR